ncbi:MAG: hypothetical protein KA007_00280 [Candidatus Pacebacteria bacterium]|jgi:hypothetical protein|nr:hypothetical protein [Candidatus Paceibacterota bacterium]
MTLDALKEEYKREVGNQQCVKQLPMDDLDQMFEEIDEANNLQDFLDVVGRWSHDAVRIGSAMVVLKKVIDLHDQ